MILGATLTVTIIASIVIISAIIIGLVLLIINVRKKMLPSGAVKIQINDQKEIVTEPGKTLLAALAENGIFLPSACGGGGTCAMCKCRVLEGGGEILPTELTHISRKEAKEGWRLACQVKIRSDMKIWVPEEVFGVTKMECEVIRNPNVATFIKEFVLAVPDDVNFDFEPGQYVQIYVPTITINYKTDICPNVEEIYLDDWRSMKACDLVMENDEEIFRAYSMANYPAEGKIIMLNVRIALPPWDRAKGQFMDVPPGICSSYIFSRRPGDKVTVSGPYGDFLIKPTDKEMIYIGGGAGMAPLRAHIFHLFKTLKTSRKVSYWYGARSLREVFYEEEFREIEKEFPNFSFHLALSDPLPEDKWDGPTGFIHQVLYDNYLKNHPEPEECEYYICGPPLMLQAVLRLLDELGVPEENIAFDDFGG